MKEWLQVLFDCIDKRTKFAKEGIEIGYSKIENAGSNKRIANRGLAVGAPGCISQSALVGAKGTGLNTRMNSS